MKKTLHLTILNLRCGGELHVIRRNTPGGGFINSHFYITL